MNHRKIIFGLFCWLGLVSVGEASQLDGMAVIRGKVSFQRHQTVVPFVVCAGVELCPQSQPFWTLVVSDSRGKYEIDEIFALGSERAPRQVEVSGLTVHEGCQVIVEGQVDPLGDDYGIVSRIKSLEVVS